MNIIQQPDSLSLSQNLKEFLITSDVQISFVLKQGDVEILSQRYDPPTKGNISIDVRDVIHGRLSYTLKDSSTVYQQFSLVDNFTAVIDSIEVTFRVIRSGVDRIADSATNFLTQNFLTWQPSVKPVTYYSPEFLTYYAVVSGTVKLRAYFTDNSGTVTSQTDYTIVDVLPSIAYTIPLQYSVVAGWLGHRLPAYYDVWVENPSGQRLTYIQRYYAEDMRSEQEQWVLFENSLGGLDTFRAYGNTAFNSEHTHNLAEIDEVSQEYRIDTERKFQKNTGHLNNDERKWLLDFFPSKGKYCYTGNYLRPIVVVESNVSYTDKELPSNYTFTFKFADARPLLNLPRTDVPADVLNITVPSVGSFTVPPRLAEFPHLPLSEGALFPIQNPYSEEWGTTTTGSLVRYILQAVDSPVFDIIDDQLNRCIRKDQPDNTIYPIDFMGGLSINSKRIGDVIRYYDDPRKVSTDADIYTALMTDQRIEEEVGALDDKYLRKDQPDSTFYPVDFMGGLSINSKRIGDVIRYYDEVRAVSTDANIYSALMTDQRIEEELEELDDRYLRKDKEDVAHKHITFEEGITVYELAELMNLDVKNLATIAKAVVSILRSSKFVDGFSGEGYQIWQDIASGDWNLTIDRVTVRKVMTIYELIIQKIRSVGGMVAVSAANGKVKTVDKIGNQYLFTFEDANQFQPNDLMRCQVFTGKDVKYYWVKVATVSGESVMVPVSEFAGVVPAVGDECVLMGNTTNKRRQSLIIISATEDGQPRFDCLNGVKTKSFEGCLKVRVGNLDGISDSRFPENMQPSGDGLYGNNCFLTGIFVLSNGKDVMTMFSIMEGMIKSEISSVRNEINEKDNYLSNAAFTKNITGWTGTSKIRIFSVNGKLLMFNNNFYANKEAFANIISKDNKNVLRLKNSSITQKNADYAMRPSFDLCDIIEKDEEGNETVVGEQYRARMFYVSFKYMVTRPGTLRVYFKGESQDGFEEYKSIDCTEYLQPSEEFKTMEIAGKWSGTGDFHLSFTGDMYIYSLALADNRLADAIENFNMRFELTDKKLQLNFDEIKKTGTKLEEYHSEFLFTAREMQIKFSEDLVDSERNITEAYRSHVSLTARELQVEFTADIDNAETRVTEAYTGAISMSAQGLQTKFTADITDMEVGITSSYESYVSLTARELKAGFTEDLSDLRTGVTQAYTAAIDFSARGLRTDFTSNINDINGKLTSHKGSFHVSATEIKGLVSETNDLGTRYSELKIEVGNITTTVSGLSGDYSQITQEVNRVKTEVADARGNSASLSVELGRIEGRVGSMEGDLSIFEQTAKEIEASVTASDGRLATLQITANGIDQRVSDANGNLATLKASADNITQQLIGVGGEATSIVARLGKIEQTVVDKDGIISSINQTAEAIRISASKIELNGDVIAQSIRATGLNVNDNFIVDRNGNIIVNNGMFNGKISTFSNGARVEMNPDSNSLKIYNSDNIEILTLDYFLEEWQGNNTYLPRLVMRRYLNTSILSEMHISSSNITIFEGLGVKSMLSLSPTAGLKFYSDGILKKHYPAS